MFLRENKHGLGGRIAGIGAYLPEAILTSEELERRIALQKIPVTRGFIERVTGIQCRHVASPEENASDLAVYAARAALEDAGVEASDIDLLIFAAASHDITEPATANIVQAKLGARDAETYDVKNACNSLVSALDVANAYIRADLAEVVLIATGEIPSRAVDLEFTSQADLMQKFGHLTMGDAGAALLVTRSREIGKGVLATAGVTRGEQWHLGTILSGGTMFPRDMSSDRAYLRSLGQDLEASGRVEVPPIARAVLDAAGWAAGSVDIVAIQQHTERIVCEIVSMTGIPADRAMLPLRYAGNAVAANIPLALVEARKQNKLVPGAHVLCIGGSSGFSVVISAVCW